MKPILKHSISLYNLQAYTRTGKGSTDNKRTANYYKTAQIPNRNNSKSKQADTPSSDLYLFDIIKDFIDQSPKTAQRTKKGSVAYKYEDYISGDLPDNKGKYLIVTLKRGDFGTKRAVEAVYDQRAISEEAEQAESKTIEVNESTLEPFFLGFFIPKDKRSAFFFAPKRGNINLRSIFWDDFKRYFRSKAKAYIECELLLTGAAYKEWLSSDVVEIIASVERVQAPKDTSDVINNPNLLGRYNHYRERISIKPKKDVRDKLKNFIRIKNNDVILIDDSIKSEIADFDNVKVSVQLDNGTIKNFPIKNADKELEQQFHIELPGLEYNSDGHPTLNSIVDEYEKVYQDYKEFLKE